MMKDRALAIPSALGTHWHTGRSLARQASGIFLAMFIASTAGWIASIAMARLYSHAAVAVAGGTLSLAALGTALGNFGLYTHVLQRLHRSPDPSHLVGSVYLLALGFGVLAALVLLPGAPDRQYLVLLGFFLVTILPLIYNMHEAACFALGLAGYAARRSLITQGLRLFLLVALASLGPAGVLASVAISTTIMIIWVHFRVLVPFAGQAKYSLGAAFHLLRSSVPTLGANYVTDWLGWIPVALFPIILLHVASLEQSALAYVVLMITLTASSVPNAFATAEFSRRCGEVGDGGLRQSAVWLTLAIAASLSLIATIGAPFALELFGSFYRAGGVLPLQVLLASLVPATIRFLFVAQCRLTSHRGDMTLVTALSTAALLGGGILGAERAGLNGAAMGWCAAQWTAGTFAAIVWWGRNGAGRREESGSHVSPCTKEAGSYATPRT